MTRRPTGSMSARNQYGTVVRDRDAEVLSAPTDVSSHAQAKPLNMKTFRSFHFNQVDDTALPDRPRTSGDGAATSANLFTRRNAEARITKDDLYFNTQEVHEKGIILHDFPFPATFPMPPTSRTISPPPRNSSLAYQSPTPDSKGIEHVNGHGIPIGMAMESPTHQSASSQPRTDRALQHQFDDSVGDSAVPVPAKPKSSKWKLLGELFGGPKKQSPVPSPNPYKFQPERLPTTVRTIVESNHVTWDTEHGISEQKSPGRARTYSERKTSRRKFLVKRSHTAPEGQFADESRKGEYPEIRLEGDLLRDATAQNGNGNPGLMLNVNIPSVEMERYSVMFSNLLEKPIGSSSSSLLSRRRATLDRLKTVNEEAAVKEMENEELSNSAIPTRRATSPQPTKSPAFSLFPITPSGQGHNFSSPNGHRSPLYRSNTSPAILSPMRPSFAPGLDNNVHASLLEPGPHIPSEHTPHQRSESHSHSMLSAHSATKRKPIASSISQVTPRIITNQDHMHRLFTPGQLHLSLSPDSDSDMFDSAALPMKPTLLEPSWQMLTPARTPASVSGSATSYSDHSTSASASSFSTSVSTTPHSTIASSAQKNSSGTSPNKSLNTISLPISAFNATKNPPQAHTNRSRATITAQLPRVNTGFSRKGSQTSITSSTASPAPTSAQTPNKREQQLPEDDHEARLNSLADVSIARQISISRQQSQMLLPIKGSVKRTTSAANEASERAKTETLGESNPEEEGYNRHTPSPFQGLKDLNTVNMSRSESPLGAMRLATAGEHKRERERERGNIRQRSQSRSPLADKLENSEWTDRNQRKGKEMLVSGVRAITPTLVVVGSPKNWSGNIATSGSFTGGKLGLAERRRKGKEERGSGTAGLVVGTSGYRKHQHRKSEKVVVERVSMDSPRT